MLLQVDLLLLSISSLVRFSCKSFLSQVLKSSFCSFVRVLSFSITSSISFQRALFSSKLLFSEISFSFSIRIAWQVCFFDSASLAKVSVQTTSFGIKFFRELNKSALFDLSSSDSTKSHSIILEISAEFANFKSSINEANSFMILVFSIGSFHSSFSLCK